MFSTKSSSSFFLALFSPHRKIKGEKLRTGQKTVIILSTGRTGTQFFAKFFNNHPDITALHEPKPSRLIRMWSIARIEGKADKGSLAKVLYKKRKKLLSKISTPVYVESNPYLFGAADCLDDVFDEPIVINVVRDPRTYIKSSLNHGNAKGLKYLLNKYLPYWYPKTYKILAQKDAPESLLIRNAQYWKIINTWLEKSCSKYKKYFVFKFEDLFQKNDSKELERFAEILGADKSFVKKSKIHAANKSKDSAIKDWGEWSVKDCKDVESICQPLMKKYGYGKEKEWLDKINS